MNDRLVVEGPVRLSGTVTLPGDKSISHRAVLLASRASGPSVLRNLSPGADLAASRRLGERLGATYQPREGGVVVVPGKGGPGPEHVDCSNSGTTMRLGAGLLAGRPGITVLEGDGSLTTRPMQRVVNPLLEMGGDVRSDGGHPPLTVFGQQLRGATVRLEVPSAQIKGAVLLAALDADGPTTVVEATPTRAHTEEMLAMVGVEIEVEPASIRVSPGPTQGLDLQVPADPSAAAFWMVAACITPGSRIRAESVYLGPGRDGFVAILKRMGADLAVEAESAGRFTLEAAHTDLAATLIDDPVEIAACIDELPALLVAAATADGTTVLRNASELRIKESDRILAMAGVLRAFGVEVEVFEDGLAVHGGRLSAARVDSGGDHRVAMAAAVAGMAASGRSEIARWSSVAVSDPGFEQVLQDVRIPG